MGHPDHLPSSSPKTKKTKNKRKETILPAPCRDPSLLPPMRTRMPLQSPPRPPSRRGPRRRAFRCRGRCCAPHSAWRWRRPVPQFRPRGPLAGAHWCGWGLVWCPPFWCGWDVVVRPNIFPAEPRFLEVKPTPTSFSLLRPIRWGCRCRFIMVCLSARPRISSL